ncbi:MAG: universal stress protein [Myxococcales bacterium]|nr:universal stress protein [Myxococcales bacterium]
MNDRTSPSPRARPSSPATADARWVVGLDLGERSLGALAFAHWLSHDSDHMVGVYVLETWMRPYVEVDVITSVHSAVAGAATRLRIPAPARVTVVEAMSAEDGLARAAEGAAGLVIGRAARAGEAPMVRLGHVARRLLRTLPGPVVVVPRDLTAVAAGPVLLATDLDDTTTAALPFAQALAARHGRKLELVHVGEARHNDLIDELEPSWLAAREEHRATVERELGAWAHAHGLGELRRHVGYGDPALKIAEIAAARDAALVVVGSRHLGIVGRIFLSSTASALAGAATCPVAVVPPA